MKKILSLAILCAMAGAPVFAGTHGTNGDVSGRSVGAAALSLIIWPGIGQAVNGNPSDKNIAHALIGLFPPFRIWSCYDALVDRTGGVWENRI